MQKDGINITISFEDKKVLLKEQCCCELELIFALANLKIEDDYNSNNISNSDYKHMKEQVNYCFDLINKIRKNKKF